MGSCQSVEAPPSVALSHEVLDALVQFRDGDSEGGVALSELRILVRTLIQDDIVGGAIREELVSLELEAEAHSRSCKAPLGELREQRRIEAEQQEEEARLAAEAEAALERELKAAMEAKEAEEAEEAEAKAKELERIEELKQKQEEAARKLEELRKTPPPVSVLEVFKAPGGALMRSLTKWQSRTFVVEAGVLYYYESSNLVEGRIEYPYGKNIKGYLSMRNAFVFTDFEDMDPGEIIIRKLSAEQVREHEIRRARSSTGGSLADSSKLSNDDAYAYSRAGMEQDDIIIKPALAYHKMDVVRQLQEHIEFADNNNVGTPLPEENERTLPLTNKKGLAVLKTSRFGLTRNRAKTKDDEETKVDVLDSSSGNASSPAAQA